MKTATPKAKATKITPEFLEENAIKIDRGETDWGEECVYVFKKQYYAVKAYHTVKGKRMKTGVINYTLDELRRMNYCEKVVKMTEDQALRQLVDQSLMGIGRRMMLKRLGV